MLYYFRVDNNALLWLMLEIFQDEEEQFVKVRLTGSMFE